jgi:hypothetical protein
VRDTTAATVAVHRFWRWRRGQVISLGSGCGPSHGSYPRRAAAS